MGSPLNDAYEAKAVFMFSLLDYSTWNIYSAGEFVGQVMLNSSDRSTSFWAADFESPLTEFLSQRSFNWWVRYLNNHRDL